MTPHDGILRLVPCSAAGLALAAGLGGVAVLRHDRPLHAYGQAHQAVLAIDQPAGIGVDLLDQVAEHPVVARTSRAMSLSHRGPDVIGLALRTLGGATAELLFASTGTGVVSRYLLQLRTGPDTATMTTLLPMTCTAGNITLSLTPTAPGQWQLAWAPTGDRRWRPIGLLRLGESVADPGHFDPIGRPPRGLRPPRWVRVMRAPAYAVARAVQPNVTPPREGEPDPAHAM